MGPGVGAPASELRRSAAGGAWEAILFLAITLCDDWLVRRSLMSDRDTDFRNPKRVRLTIACVYLSNYFPKDDQGVIAKARAILDEHNLDVDVWPDNGKKQAINTLAYSADPVPHDDEAYKALRAAVDEKIKKGGCTFVIPLPIVFCQFQYSGHGTTPHAMKKLTHACLISTTVNNDKVTLVHEMGHAAGLGHENGQGNRGNFMHEAEPRSQMYRFQVEKMAKAMYAVGG
jgi:hypothetical protein